MQEFEFLLILADPAAATGRAGYFILKAVLSFFSTGTFFSLT